MQLLYRGGLFGLIAFLRVVAQGVNTLRVSLRRKDDAMAPLLFAMMVALLVFYIPYGLEYSQMIVFGLLLGMITKERTMAKVAEQVTLDKKNGPRQLAGRVVCMRMPLHK